MTPTVTALYHDSQGRTYGSDWVVVLKVTDSCIERKRFKSEALAEEFAAQFPTTRKA